MPLQIDGKEGNYFAQSEVDGIIAESRRTAEQLREAQGRLTRVSELETRIVELGQQNKALTETVTNLNRSLTDSTQKQLATEHLLQSGLRPERIKHALRNIPEGADFGDSVKARTAITMMQDELPEWFGHANASPGNTGAQQPGAAAPAQAQGTARQEPVGVAASPQNPQLLSMQAAHDAALKEGDASRAIAIKGQMYGLSTTQ
jgi:hypothetical protein